LRHCLAGCVKAAKESMLKRIWYNFNILNIMRRKINFLRLRLLYSCGLKPPKGLKLNLGCGSHAIEGFMNIDWIKTEAADLVCDIRKLPFPDSSVEVIEAYHVIEHFPRNEVSFVLKEWRRVLLPSGRLILEFPDFDKAVKEYLEGKQERLDSIFGLQRFSGDAHFFGYNLKRLSKLLNDAGFIEVESRPAQDYHCGNEPCLRLECRKGR